MTSMVLMVLSAVAGPVVLVPLDAVDPPPERPEAPPVPWISDGLEISVAPGAETGLTLRWTLRPLAPGWVELPLIGSAAAVRSAKLDGVPVSLSPGQDGMQHLVLYLDRPRRVVVEASLPTPATSLKLPVAAATRRTLEVAGDWQLSSPGAVLVAGRLWGGDPGRLDLSWRQAGPKPPRPTLLRAEAATAVRLDSAGLESAALLRWRISNGSVSELRFRLPGAIQDLEVEGDGVLGFSRQGQQVVVRLARPVSDSVALRVRFRAAPGGDAGGDLALPWPEANEVSGYATLLRADEALVVPTAGSGAEAVSASALPDWANGLSEGTPLATYRLSGRDPHLGVRVLRWDPIDGPPTVIDEARYEIATVEHGRLVIRARYQVRNDRRQFLRMDVPAELSLVSVTVAGRAVQAARDEDGKLLIPLEKSVETLSGLVTFPVDIAFFGLEAAWERRGERVIATPSVDAPIAYARWELVLPAGFGAVNVDSNADEVPGWSSREVTLDYGRSYGEGLADDIVPVSDTGSSHDAPTATTTAEGVTLSKEFLQRIPTGRSYQEVVASVPGVVAAEEDARSYDEDDIDAENLVIETRGRRGEKVPLPRQLDRLPSAKPAETPKPAPTPAPQARAPAKTTTTVVQADDVSQLYWNEAYNAYKENRFEDSKALLDQSLSYNPDNAAAAALSDNLSVLLNTTGDSTATGEDEAATRRVREMARARSSGDELRQDALLRKAEEAERAGNLAEAEKTLEELVEVSGKLAGVEQAEQVDKKGAYREAQERLSSTRQKMKKDEAPSSGGLDGRGSGLGGGGTAEGLGGLGAQQQARINVESAKIVITDDGDTDEDGWNDGWLRSGYATIILEDQEAARQMQQGLVIEPDIAALLSGSDLVWTGDEDLRTERVFQHGLPDRDGDAMLDVLDARPVVLNAPKRPPPVLALPQTVPIPRAGQILRFEARLVPEGQPLTANITYHPARDPRSR